MSDAAGSGYARLEHLLSAIGLRARGGFCPSSGEAIPGPAGEPAATLVLVGAVGDSHWPAFSRSPEVADGRPGR